MEIEEVILSIFEECFSEKENIRDKLLSEEQFTAIGVDSVEVIKVIVEIEKKLNVTFDDDYLSLEEFTCLEDIVKYVKTLPAEE